MFGHEARSSRTSRPSHLLPTLPAQLQGSLSLLPYLPRGCSQLRHSSLRLAAGCCRSMRGAVGGLGFFQPLHLQVSLALKTQEIEPCRTLTSCVRATWSPSPARRASPPNSHPGPSRPRPRLLAQAPPHLASREDPELLQLLGARQPPDLRLPLAGTLLLAQARASGVPPAAGAPTSYPGPPSPCAPSWVCSRGGRGWGRSGSRSLGGSRAGGRSRRWGRGRGLEGPRLRGWGRGRGLGRFRHGLPRSGAQLLGAPSPRAAWATGSQCAGAVAPEHHGKCSLLALSLLLPDFSIILCPPGPRHQHPQK